MNHGKEFGKAANNLLEVAEFTLTAGSIASEGFYFIYGAKSLINGDNMGSQFALLGVYGLDFPCLFMPLAIGGFMDVSAKSQTLAGRISKAVNLAELGVAVAGSMLFKSGFMSGRNDLLAIGAIAELAAGATAFVHAASYRAIVGIKNLPAFNFTHTPPVS